MDSVQVMLNSALLLFLITTIACSQDCHPLDQCSCKLDSGKIISLWEIDKGFGKSYTLQDAGERGFTYQYSPCIGLSLPKSECNGALLCQEQNSDKFALAFNSGPVKTLYDPINKEYQFMYTGSTTKTTSARLTTVVLACNQASLPDPAFSAVAENPTGTYTLSVTTKCACPGQCKYSPKPKPNPPSSSSKLSTGSILCILFFVFLIIYVIGGLLINKYVRHKEGSEIVPNRDFWKDVPSLIKDGSMFTYQKISGKGSEYERIS